jgi:hypothetical protein
MGIGRTEVGMVQLDRELLAELDAGLLTPDRAARVQAAADADPSACAVLAALTAVRADLQAMPFEPPPPQFVRRWTNAIAAEQTHATSPMDLDWASGRPPSRLPNC